MLRPSKFQQNASDDEKTSNNVFKPFLKPSQLQFGSTSAFGVSESSVSSDSSSNPFNNPFMTAVVNNGDDDSTTEAATNKDESGKGDENSDPLSQLSRATLPKSNLFTVKGSSFTEGTGFVFGQNISERVTGAATEANCGEVTMPSAATTTTAEQQGKCEETPNNSNNLFSRLNNSAGAEGSGMEKKEVDGQSLLEATRKYEEKCKVQKRKYEKVETKTGEEDERNIFEINCKVFAFVSSNYEERGRGTLRLNDSKTNQNESRVVFRTSGNFRVLINTKVWAGMVVELPSPKSLRMTAIDSEGHIKVFLLMARPEDVNQLHKFLKERVSRQKDLEFCPKAPIEIRVEHVGDDDDGNIEEDYGEPQPKKAIIENNMDEDVVAAAAAIN